MKTYKIPTRLNVSVCSMTRVEFESMNDLRKFKDWLTSIEPKLIYWIIDFEGQDRPLGFSNTAKYGLGFEYAGYNTAVLGFKYTWIRSIINKLFPNKRKYSYLTIKIL